MSDKTMTPLSIEEILELPIGSKVVVKRAGETSSLFASSYCRVSSFDGQRVELDAEVTPNGTHYFCHVDLSEELTATVFPVRFCDATEQVFLDKSGVDRVYSDKSSVAEMTRPVISYTNLNGINDQSSGLISIQKHGITGISYGKTMTSLAESQLSSHL